MSKHAQNIFITRKKFYMQLEKGLLVLSSLKNVLEGRIIGLNCEVLCNTLSNLLLLF